jgi:hypothetical protein
MNSGVLPRRPVQLFGPALQAAHRPLIRNDHKPCPPPARGQLAPVSQPGVLSCLVGCR